MQHLSGFFRIDFERAGAGVRLTGVICAASAGVNTRSGQEKVTMIWFQQGGAGVSNVDLIELAELGHSWIILLRGSRYDNVNFRDLALKISMFQQHVLDAAVGRQTSMRFQGCAILLSKEREGVKADFLTLVAAFHVELFDCPGFVVSWMIQRRRPGQDANRRDGWNPLWARNDRSTAYTEDAFAGSASTSERESRRGGFRSAAGRNLDEESSDTIEDAVWEQIVTKH